MEIFINQIWLALMSAFVVLGFVVATVCSIWLVKIIAIRLPHARAPKHTNT